MFFEKANRKTKEIRKINTQVHYLKTLPEYYKDVFYHNKKFEVRKNDRDFKVNDILILEEYDPMTNKLTGRRVTRTIIYILDNAEYLQEGYVVLGIK